MVTNGAGHVKDQFGERREPAPREMIRGMAALPHPAVHRNESDALLEHLFTFAEPSVHGLTRSRGTQQGRS